MGLDMYAYVAAKAGQQKEYWDNVEYDREKGCYVHQSESCSQPIEIAYWRKHPNLHGWMYNLWVSKGNSGEFNGDELELTWEDIDQLEYDVELGRLKNVEATGFFWGDPSDDYYYEADVKFIKEARSQLFLGLKVFYNSSW
jgi:hypothetical protein